MRITVIGATGHIGSYLVPELIRAGHEVSAVSRCGRFPFFEGMTKWQSVPSKKGFDIIPAPFDEDEWRRVRPDYWKDVKLVKLDRAESEKNGTFGRDILALKPDIVCDLTSYTGDQAKLLTDCIAGEVSHYICMGSVWIYDYNVFTPAAETQPRNGESEYGLGKISLEKHVLELSKSGKLPCTILHAGHIVGCGWIPLNPQGNFNAGLYEKIAAGEEILLPDFGTQTIHHVHSHDLSRLFLACIEQPEKSVSEAFHATSRAAVTLRGLAQDLFLRYNNNVKIHYLPMNDFLDTLSDADRAQSLEHISRSPCASMEKAEKLLGFVPRHTSADAVFESAEFLFKLGVISKNR